MAHTYAHLPPNIAHACARLTWSVRTLLTTGLNGGLLCAVLLAGGAFLVSSTKAQHLPQQTLTKSLQTSRNTHLFQDLWNTSTKELSSSEAKRMHRGLSGRIACTGQHIRKEGSLHGRTSGSNETMATAMEHTMLHSYQA